MILFELSNPLPAVQGHLWGRIDEVDAFLGGNIPLKSKTCCSKALLYYTVDSVKLVDPKVHFPKQIILKKAKCKMQIKLGIRSSQHFLLA